MIFTLHTHTNTYTSRVKMWCDNFQYTQYYVYDIYLIWILAFKSCAILDVYGVRNALYCIYTQHTTHFILFTNEPTKEDEIMQKCA